MELKGKCVQGRQLNCLVGASKGCSVAVAKRLASREVGPCDLMVRLILHKVYGLGTLLERSMVNDCGLQVFFGISRRSSAAALFKYCLPTVGDLFTFLSKS